MSPEGSFEADPTALTGELYLFLAGREHVDPDQRMDSDTVTLLKRLAEVAASEAAVGPFPLPRPELAGDANLAPRPPPSAVEGRAPDLPDLVEQLRDRLASCERRIASLEDSAEAQRGGIPLPPTLALRIMECVAASERPKTAMRLAVDLGMPIELVLEALERLSEGHAAHLVAASGTEGPIESRAYRLALG